MPISTCYPDNLVLNIQILTVLESAVRRDFLVSDYETTNELLDSRNLKGHMVTNIPNLETTAVLPWIPQTTSAVALRLTDFDKSICYTLQQKEDSEKDKGAKHIIVSISCPILQTTSFFFCIGEHGSISGRDE